MWLRLAPRFLLAGVLATVGSVSCRDPNPTDASASEQPSATAANPVLELTLGDLTREYSLTELRATLPPASARVFNPDYNTEITYQGFYLADLLRHAGYALSGDGDDEIAFECVDGYRPSRPAKLVERLEMLVAFEQAGGGWELIPHGKAMVTPGPFYVVSTAPKTFQEFPWPFQVVGISVERPKQRFAKVYPTGAGLDGPVYAGFKLFRTQCLSCHSINLSGGEIGPELNIPKNITEYREPAFLEAYITNPSAFRARSPMPPSGLDPVQVRQVIAYLQYMAGLKQNPPDDAAVPAEPSPSGETG